MRKAGLAPLVLASLAVLAGAAFLWDVGALPGMASRNLVAFAIGFALGLACYRAAGLTVGAAGLFLTASAILLIVLVSGVEIDGVRRWLQIGPMALQPALIACPMLLALATGRRDWRWRLGLGLPLTLIALQPDAAALIAFATGVAVLTFRDEQKAGLSRRDGRLVISSIVILGALILLACAGFQTPPPVAFVEGTISIAATSGATAMVLHLLAIALMLAALFKAPGGQGRPIAAYFLVITIAAIFWAFPMPLAGASPSHLIGFGLAIGWATALGRAARPTTETLA